MNRIDLRPWTLNDLESLVHYANDPLISNNLMNRFPYPYTQDNGKQFIDMANQHNPPHVLAISIDGMASGGIGIHPQEDIFFKNAELGYWLAHKYWGKGIMSEMVKKMIPYCFDHFDIERIFARPFGNNIGSQKVLEKAGFIFEAKLKATIFKNNKYEDEMIYCVRRPS